MLTLLCTRQDSLSTLNGFFQSVQQFCETGITKSLLFEDKETEVPANLFKVTELESDIFRYQILSIGCQKKGLKDCEILNQMLTLRQIISAT